MKKPAPKIFVVEPGDPIEVRFTSMDHKVALVVSVTANRLGHLRVTSRREEIAKETS